MMTSQEEQQEKKTLMKRLRMREEMVNGALGLRAPVRFKFMNALSTQ